MTKLIDSLCGVNRLKGRNRIQDSYNDVSPEKVAKAKEFVKEEADRPEDALYEVMDYLYEAPVAIDTDRDILDVESKGHYWPNEDAYRSSIVKVNEPGVAMTSLWGSGDPRDLWFIPLPVAEICEIDDPKVTPGYYYLDGETNTIERIGETSEDLDKWVASLDTDETIEARKREFERREQFERDKRRMSAETSRENVEDSAKEDNEERSKVLAELKELLKSVSYDKIVEALDYFMSPEEVARFSKLIREFYGIKDSKVADFFIPLDPDRLKPNRDDFRKMDTLCCLIRDFDLDKGDLSKALRALKQLYDKAKSSGGSDTREEEVIFEDTYRTLKDHGWLDKEPSQVSDAVYNPKFEKLRRVLSDTTIVEELSHYMSSDELEEFTETLTRNYDIDLEEVEDSAK